MLTLFPKEIFNIEDRSGESSCDEEKPETLKQSTHLSYNAKRPTINYYSYQNTNQPQTNWYVTVSNLLLTGKCSSKGVILSDTYIIFPSVIIAKKKPSRAWN